ncbi:ribonuclease D [Mucisphaera calidilacus]|uniref:Ribonuclease D n=1 Tax=Mucisphaera calidilacus TaxID=2527982 RepID=A0A518BZX3_9BACT|nr:HRDC domain-containing protein [Mucisphaera calidilacus]QDU72526.1 Ribonuclease D [Mucisphaera calidilacus]
MVATQDQLRDLIDHLATTSCFGYDTEFIGETTFYPRICLIQIATQDKLYLIDSLADIDLLPFWNLLATPGPVKLVHAGRQDLEPVPRLTGKPPRTLYDVQIAAGFCGLGYPLSLGKLIEAVTGADLGHSVKFSQWDRRPLTDKQKHYAANDVRYLPLAYLGLKKRIDQLGHTDKVAEDMLALEEADRYLFDPLSGRLRGAGAGRLNRRGRALLERLLIKRFEIARAVNLPPRSLMGDDVLVRLADHPPADTEALARIKGMPRPLARDNGHELIAAIEDGKRAPLPPAPRRPGIDPDEHKARIETTWSRLQKHCDERSIDPGLLISKRDLSTLLLPESDRQSRDYTIPTGWRRDILNECWPDDHPDITLPDPPGADP